MNGSYVTWTAAILALLAVRAPAPGPARGVGDSERYLSAVEATEHFELRYRPGSRSGAAVDLVAVRVEEDRSRIAEALDFDPGGGFSLWLYDDTTELSKITRTGGNAGFSAGTESHVPYDNDQTRFHELVHILVLRLPREGDEDRSLFFAEGLANALLEFVTGVHVHAVTAFEKRRGVLPPIEEMTTTEDFYAWLGEHPGLGAYDVAGSWFRFLLDEYGAKRVKRYYTGVPAKKAFGKDLERLEKQWHALLDDWPLRPELETLLSRRRGLGGEFTHHDLSPDERLPAEVLGAPEDWSDLTGAELDFEIAGDWSRTDEGLRGEHPQDANWSVCELGAQAYGDCIVRATIRPDPGCVGVQVRLGTRCQALLTNAGTFVQGEKLNAAERADTISRREELDLCARRVGKQLTIWIDGFEVLQGSVEDEAAPVGIAVAGGRATFTRVRVREL